MNVDTFVKHTFDDEFKKEKTLYESNAEKNNQPGNTIKRFKNNTYINKKNQVCFKTIS